MLKVKELFINYCFIEVIPLIFHFFCNKWINSFIFKNPFPVRFSFRNKGPTIASPRILVQTLFFSGYCIRPSLKISGFSTLIPAVVFINSSIKQECTFVCKTEGAGLGRTRNFLHKIEVYDLSDLHLMHVNFTCYKDEIYGA